jgi:hypothetical protein
MSQREADGFDAATKVSLDRFEALAAEARDTLVEETRRPCAALQATAEDSRIAAAEAADPRPRSAPTGSARPCSTPPRRPTTPPTAAIEGARRIVNETAAMVDRGRPERD